MSTVTNLRTTSRRRTLLTAGVLAALVSVAGASAAPAQALVPFDGGQVNAVLTSATFQVADIVTALELHDVPAAHIAQIDKQIHSRAIFG